MSARMDDDPVADFHEQFALAPLGVWATGHSARSAQAITFFADHTGVCEIEMPGGVHTIHFEWCEHEEFTLRVREIKPTNDERATIDVDQDNWLAFVFEFQPVGRRVAMRLIEFGQLTHMPDLLHYQGPAESKEKRPTLAPRGQPRP